MTEGNWKMIELLARIGRLKAVAMMTLIAMTAAIVVTAATIGGLNSSGFEFRFDLAISLAVFVTVVVAPPICWYLLGVVLRIYGTEEEMRRLASYDSLTGLLSRHVFFDRANNYISLANREATVFSVMIIDLDKFKLVNDRYGHPAGDAVLKLFANVVNSVARRSDIVGRLGGEEFALVLPSTSSAEAIEFSGRLHKAINKAVLKYNDNIISYTASIGLTSFDPDSSDNIDDLLARADLALYQAKRSGRNQTATFNPEIKQFATA
jgi:diguanylate cyclase (GGDEF)-like protein